ncbi:MAG: lamin tail domain-containing protein [bacterium]|nr:lamin tail domain-containing protein [bacterium]
MIIYEFLPNPVGKDTDGEWIKLFNDANAAVDLGGWQIKDASGKTFSFKQVTINSGEYLTFDYKITKISLNNNGETLFLYDASGDLVDKAEYVGSAAEGKSLIRQNDGRFIFAGQAAMGETGIAATQNTAVVQDVGNLSGPLNKTNFNFTNLFVGFSLALALSFVFVFIFKKFNLLLESE